MNPQTKKSLVLHVDDDASNRHTVSKILNRSSFTVISAETGVKALELVKQHSFNLVILDIRLPDISGYEICRSLRADPATAAIPVMQTSATFTTTSDKIEGLESGADAYLIQPIVPEMLIASAQALIRMRTAEQTAVRAVKLREDILAIVSHDLRNPLAAIGLQAASLNIHAKKGNEVPSSHVAGVAQKIKKAVTSMDTLIEDLMDFSQIASDSVSLNLAPASTVDIVKTVISNLETLSASKEITLVVSGVDEKELMCDSVRLERVFSNLIGNAIKFSHQGGKIEIRGELKTQEYWFSITDNGVGIAPSDIPFIFDRYWQAQKSKKSGVGLGLAIVKGLVAAHDGEIRVESAPNAETVFAFSIPFAKENQDRLSSVST